MVYITCSQSMPLHFIFCQCTFRHRIQPRNTTCMNRLISYTGLSYLPNNTKRSVSDSRAYVPTKTEMELKHRREVLDLQERNLQLRTQVLDLKTALHEERNDKTRAEIEKQLSCATTELKKAKADREDATTKLANITKEYAENSKAWGALLRGKMESQDEDMDNLQAQLTNEQIRNNTLNHTNQHLVETHQDLATINHQQKQTIAEQTKKHNKLYVGQLAYSFEATVIYRFKFPTEFKQKMIPKSFFELESLLRLDWIAKLQVEDPKRQKVVTTAKEKIQAAYLAFSNKELSMEDDSTLSMLKKLRISEAHPPINFWTGGDAEFTKMEEAIRRTVDADEVEATLNIANRLRVLQTELKWVPSGNL